MKEFLTSSDFLLPLFGFLKAFAVAMFGLNVGVILTWVERRLRGMIQDSLGPNRAAIPVPGFVAAGLAAGPAALVALGVGAAAATNFQDVSSYPSLGFLFTHGGIFVTWLTLSAIARVVRKTGAKNGLEAAIGELGAPRSIVLAGFAAHAVFAFLSIMTTGSALEAQFNLFQFAGGATLLVVSTLAGAGHVASGLAKQKTVRITLLGLLHPAADGLKTAFKADFIPQNGDRVLFNLAPWISFFPALIVIAVVPFGPALCFGKEKGQINFFDFQGLEHVGTACQDARFSLQVADLNVGILYFFAMAGMGIVGAALAGWASDNKFSLLGGMRAASQMVSYEVTMGLTVVGAMMVYGTVRVDEMVLWQANNSWGIFVQPLAFFLFFAAAIAESKRVPFDIPEGESEIVAGYFLEYAGMKFAMFFFSEFIAVVTSSTLMAALFLGGWHLPFATGTGIEVVIGDTELLSVSLSNGAILALGMLGFVGKILTLCWVQVTIRWTLPRFRYDQLMRLGWRKLLPASLVNVVVTAIVILAIQSGGEQFQRGVTVAGQLTMALLAVGGLAGFIALVLFLLAPVKKQRLVVSSAQRYASELGGTFEAKMEA